MSYPAYLVCCAVIGPFVGIVTGYHALTSWQWWAITCSLQLAVAWHRAGPNPSR